ncbi:MAG TPA: hypothetical protein VGB92_18250 [Longimicrobium sp.]|jgi:hypothetical protein
MIGSRRSLPSRAFAGALLLLASSCGILDSDPVKLRVRNASSYDLEAIRVSRDRMSASYGSVAAGETSRYRSVSGVYQFAYAEARLDGTRVEWLPRDFVRAEPLETGSYTYELTVYQGRHGYELSATLVRD